MSGPVSVDSFQRELARLVETSAKNLAAYKSTAYGEASLRQEFLNPFFRALGWDIENKAGLIPQHREVEIESRTQIGGRQKRADYLFRTHPTDRFVCEAKKPAEELHSGYAFQAKRYAWNKGLPLAVLTDFEEIKIFIVGGKPYRDEPDVGLWKTYHFRQYPLIAQELWNLLARDRVAAGSIDELIESLPKKPAGKGKARQGWLFKPDRSRALDTDFLNFLDEARRELASDLLKHNDRADLLEGTQLNEAVQHILDRILFLRICEDRDIDTGRPLDHLVRSWRNHGEPGAAWRARQQPLELHEQPLTRPSGILSPSDGERAGVRGTLWQALVRHFRALDRRPPSHIPFFNGNLFKPHFSEELVVSDDWLAHFLDELGDEESPYLFNYIPVEILGTIYERFLGKVVRPHGRGVTIEEKPEVRKAGGVYYTPRYIVEYIVGQTVGKLLADRKPEEALKLRLLDPACGSGSFLIRAFEVVCEYCQQWLTDNLRAALGDPLSRPSGTLSPPGGARAGERGALLAAWMKKHRDWCWLEDNAVHLTTKAKRRILRETIHGVDLDPQAVEVTQLSLYLKMLEGENRAMLARECDLFGSDDALLPPLENNIKRGNSLIASDFSLVPDDLVRVHAFDWPVQFPAIMKAGGFDAVIGNPPWGQKAVDFSDDEKEYIRQHYAVSRGILDLFKIFCERSLNLTRLGGRWGMVLPDIILLKDYPETRRLILEHSAIAEIAYSGMAFDQVDLDTVCLVCERNEEKAGTEKLVRILRELTPSRAAQPGEPDLVLPQATFWRLKDYKFNIYLDPGRLALLEKLERLPKLGDFFEAHEGIHSGNVRAKLFLDEPVNKQCKQLIFGRDEVGRYFLRWGGKWVNYHDRAFNKANGEYANLAHPEYFEPPKVFVRRTGDFVMAVADEKGFYASNNLFVALPREAGCALSLRTLVGLLNSKFMTWYFRAIQPRVGKVFAELKINQLHQFPLPPSESFASVSSKSGPLVETLQNLAARLRNAASDPERQVLQNAMSASEALLDELVFGFYQLCDVERHSILASETKANANQETERN